jgi:surface antigen
MNRQLKVHSLFVLLSGLTAAAIGMSASPVKAETFSINNRAMDTGFHLPRINGGGPRMVLWDHNVNSDNQNFDLISGRSGQLLRHRSTGWCLNAYRASAGSHVNTYPCNPNDPEQNFSIADHGNWYRVIRLANTNLCVDSTPSTNNGQQVIMWHCLPNGQNRASSNSNSNSNSASTLGIPVNFGSAAYRQNPFWPNFAPQSVGGYLWAVVKGNCTWYANGRLRELGYSSSDLNRLVGNAKEWAGQARNAGIPTGNTPRVGAIAQWVSGGGGYGHVAVVESVNSNGTITISESSYSTDSRYTYLHRHNTIPANSVENYIYVRR